MTRTLYLIAALFAHLPAAAAAQDWAFRDTDSRFAAPAELTEALSGQRLIFFDDGESRFSPGGAYSYTYSAVNGGGSQFGTWEARPDGIVCIAYRNGASRCDMYVQAAGRWVVLTEDGQRYPTR